MKTVLLTPGRGENIADRPYQHVLDIVEDAGYISQFVPIDWGEHDIRPIQELQSQLAQAYERHTPEDTIFLGFSLSAVMSFCVAAEQTPAAVWSCSLSPMFQEDLTPEGMASFKSLSPQQLESYRHLSFAALARKITCPVELFVGSEELDVTINRTVVAASQLATATMTIVPEAGHDITHPSYLAALRSRLSRVE